MWVKNSLKRAQSLTVSLIFTIFLFSFKIQDSCQKWRKLKFLSFAQVPLQYPAGQKFAQIGSISYSFEIFTLSYFPLKSKW